MSAENLPDELLGWLERHRVCKKELLDLSAVERRYRDTFRAIVETWEQRPALVECQNGTLYVNKQPQSLPTIEEVCRMLSQRDALLKEVNGLLHKIQQTELGRSLFPGS